MCTHMSYRVIPESFNYIQISLNVEKLVFTNPKCKNAPFYCVTYYKRLMISPNWNFHLQIRAMLTNFMLKVTNTCLTLKLHKNYTSNQMLRCF